MWITLGVVYTTRVQDQSNSKSSHPNDREQNFGPEGLHRGCQHLCFKLKYTILQHVINLKYKRIHKTICDNYIYYISFLFQESNLNVNGLGMKRLWPIKHVRMDGHIPLRTIDLCRLMHPRRSQPSTSIASSPLNLIKTLCLLL